MVNPEKPATRRRKTKQKHKTICVGHHHAQTMSFLNQIIFYQQS
jgi:hypothetical protein